MKYKARVCFKIKHKHVHPQDRDRIGNPMGFQIMINMAMTRWVPKGSGVTWAVVSQWVTEL